MKQKDWMPYNLKKKEHATMNNKNSKIVKKQSPVEGSIEELQGGVRKGYGWRMPI